MAVAIATPMATAMAVATPRSLVCHYNPTLVAAALIVSLLGAFTSTQLMSQARGARTLSGVLIWTVLGCLVFGFCATWCLHFLGMLSCEFDVPIGLNPPLTVLSAILAVSFTFGALSTDLIQKYWQRPRPRRIDPDRHSSSSSDRHLEFDQDPSSEPLLRLSLDSTKVQTQEDTVRGGLSRNGDIDRGHARASSADALLTDFRAAQLASHRGKWSASDENTAHHMNAPSAGAVHGSFIEPDTSDNLDSAEDSPFRLSLDDPHSQGGSGGFDDNLSNSFAYKSSATHADNTLMIAFRVLLSGITLVNVSKGFIWSIALTNMHFMGVKALDIPSGYVILNPVRVVLCAFISWSVCTVGVIMMAGMEVNIKQQVLFSVVAASGVGAVHFSGMYACSFWSSEASSPNRGYPIALPVVIAGTAIFTCMASTGLLAHSATIARDKLAEVLYTRRRLWAAIAQKESAEAAAAARGEFIASASHEIRTPLHQLQGYVDLLLLTELSEEGHGLSLGIQHATRSLTMITSNVLDWSRLERGETVCRPVTVDIRLASETIVHVLPNTNENTETELFVVVTPDTPPSVVIDETFLQRILMNLLSNSFKFTTTGYVMLLIRKEEGVLHVAVRDSGPGIPKSFLPQLFEPYKQVQARGAERGTGLGLSITKQLVRRMKGSITVKSKHHGDEGVGAAGSGSIFTISIPIATSGQLPLSSPARFNESLRVAIMHDGRHRDIEGITAAWTACGADVEHVKTIRELSTDLQTIIWVDLAFLKKHKDISHHLLTQQQQLVLVSFQDQVLFEDILGLAPPTHIVPIRKPLMWHRIIPTIRDAQQALRTPDPNKSLELMPINGSAHSEATTNRQETRGGHKKTVLLVEDNEVNQKLGAKMLSLLNYDVLLAADGQEAIDIVIEHAQTIDVILMDQSMPRKDGVTATKEIRALEAEGVISKRQTIIAVTAAVGPEVHKVFLEAGIDVFLSKPLSLAKLKESLSHHMGG